MYGYDGVAPSSWTRSSNVHESLLEEQAMCTEDARQISCYDLAQHAVPIRAPNFSSGDASTLLTVSCRPSPGSADLRPQGIIDAVLTGLLGQSKETTIPTMRPGL